MSFDNDFPILGVDPGNGLGKVAQYEIYKDMMGDWHLFSDLNIIVEITGRDYVNMIERLKGTDLVEGYIKIRAKGEDKYFAMGNTALNGKFIADWRKQRVMKFDKYRRGYVGLMTAYLIYRNYRQRYQDVPSQVNVVTAHPPMMASHEFRKQVTKAIAGNWKFEVGGKKVDFKIENVKVIDEVTGAARNKTLTAEGMPLYEEDSFLGRTSAVFDLGDGTVDVALLNEYGVPVSQESSNLGFFRYVQAFADEFDDKHKALFGKGAQTGIPLNLVYKIFLHPQKLLENTEWGGPTIDCRQIFDDTVSPFLAQLYTLGNTMTGGNLLAAAPQIGIAGGAGALLYDDLRESVFSPYVADGRDDVFLCGDPDKREEGIFFIAQGLAKDGEAQRREEKYVNKQKA